MRPLACGSSLEVRSDCAHLKRIRYRWAVYHLPHQQVLTALHSCHAGDLKCNNPWQGVNKETALVGDLWDYQYCTEMYMPMAKSGVADIYWSQPWDDKAARQACKDNWGVEPRAMWGTIEWGGHDLRTLSNVVFSNGLYDPWHLGGVLEDLSPTVKVRARHCCCPWHNLIQILNVHFSPTGRTAWLADTSACTRQNCALKSLDAVCNAWLQQGGACVKHTARLQLITRCLRCYKSGSASGEAQIMVACRQ